MNYQDLTQRAAFLSKQAGYQTVDPQPDWKALVNRAVADYSWDVEWNVESGTFPTVNGTAEYLLTTAGTPMFKWVMEATRDSSTALRISSEQEERDRDLLWLTRDPAPPNRYWISLPNTMRLCPVPDGVYTVVYRGVRQAPALVNPTDIPPVPETYHEGFALRASVLHLEAWSPTIEEQAMAERVWRVLQLYRDQYGGMVKDFRKWIFSDDTQSQRAVTPRLPERVGKSNYGYGYWNR